MKPEDQDSPSGHQSQQGEGGAPPNMMGMMKKMMAGMESGGENPMAMMQKMMGQMGSQTDEEGESPMPPMMMMCSSMLFAIHRTSSMAAFATPELQGMFNEWMEGLENEVLAALEQQREVDTSALASQLKISEASTIHLVGQLASKGKVSLSVRAIDSGKS